jgi:hypothetical protein
MRYQVSLMILSAGILPLITGCGSNGFKDPTAGLTTPSLGNSNPTSTTGGSTGTSTSGGSGTSTGATGSTSGSGSTGAGTSGAGDTGSGTGGSATGGSGTTGSGTTGSGTTGSGTSGSSGASAPTTVQVSLSSPGDGATVASPVHVVASAAGSPVAAMHVYVDSGDAFQTQSAELDTALNIPGGQHAILVQAWDQNGNVYKSAAINVTVSGPAAPPAPSGPSPSVSQIQRMSGWDSCSACAGKFGDGPGTSHDMATGVDSPSISGSSAKFWVGGTPWGAALWWRELGGQDDVANFRYDLDFYTDGLDSAQALEFDMNQNVGGKRYIYGTECDFRGTGTWRVWNSPSAAWVSTGVGCSQPSPGTWHHLTWEFSRSDGQVHFVAVALDGDWHDVGRSFDAIGGSGSGLDVAFQADLTGGGGGVTVWLDNVNVAWW